MALHRTVGVIGAEPDPEAVGERHQHRLDLAGGLFAQHLDRVDRARQQGRVHAVEQRRARRRRDAERGELADVVLHVGARATRPAGHDQGLGLEGDAVAAGSGMTLERGHRQDRSKVGFSATGSAFAWRNWRRWALQTVHDGFVSWRAGQPSRKAAHPDANRRRGTTVMTACHRHMGGHDHRTRTLVLSAELRLSCP
jgi:hypothetical protein